MRPEKIGRTKGFARKPDDLISRASRDDVFSLRCGGPRGSPVVQPDVLPATVEPVSEGLGLWRPPSRRCQPGHPRDVDWGGRAGTSHVEDEEEALPAREHLRFRAELGQQADGLGDRRRCQAGEPASLMIQTEVPPGADRSAGRSRHPSAGWGQAWWSW